MKTRTIRQSVIFDTRVHVIYELFLDSRRHTEFTGSKAMIDRKIGGKFSTWDGYSSGTNLELVQDKKIVQTWRASDWPEGHYSTITIILEKMDDKTKLNFTQSDVPEDKYDAVEKGWTEFYWDKMKKYLQKKHI
jgi:activator of HSP90 ATPase